MRSPGAGSEGRTPDEAPSRRWSRRGLIVGAAALGLGLADTTPGGRAAGAGPDGASPHGLFPQQDRDAVLEVVTRAHFDAEGVRELVAARPALARASWDWGFGDWESALGAASHTGRRDIAEVLIEHGARPNLFAEAMLDNLAAVKASVEARPGIQGHRGPHGLTLLHHARAGGDGARAVFAYLEELGGADPPLPVVPLPPESARGYLGTYRFGAGEDEVLEVSEREGDLRIARPPAAPRVLLPLGDHAFFPAGAEAVRVRFEAEGDRIPALTVHDPDVVARGVRLP